VKRAPVFVLAGVVAGFVGVLSFHGRPGSPVALPSSGGHFGRAGDGRLAGHASREKRRPASKRSVRRSGLPASPAVVRSALGPTEQYGYGELAVKVTVRGNRIINVTVPFIQTAEQYSQQLAGQVIPTLRSEVLASQTASIGAVSGASYTSQAYATSVQAALDKLQVR
jgi:uncharacterized protein with FMN-binding domain